MNEGISVAIVIFSVHTPSRENERIDLAHDQWGRLRHLVRDLNGAFSSSRIKAFDNLPAS